MTDMEAFADTLIALFNGSHGVIRKLNLMDDAMIEAMPLKRKVTYFGVLADHRDLSDSEIDQANDVSIRLLLSMRYPQSLLRQDKRKLSLIAGHLPEILQMLETPLVTQNKDALQSTMMDITHTLCRTLLGYKAAKKLRVDFMNQAEPDESFSARFHRPNEVYMLHGGGVKIGKGKIEYNFSGPDWHERPYYQSALTLMQLIVHELTHYEQGPPEGSQIKPISRLTRLFNAKADEYIQAGQACYVLPEVNRILYYLNPTERQARYRQYAASDIVIGKQPKPEHEYLSDYLMADEKLVTSRDRLRRHRLIA